MPGSGPIDPDLIAFEYDGARYTANRREFNGEQPLVLLPEGRLLRATSWLDGAPYGLMVVPYAKASPA